MPDFLGICILESFEKKKKIILEGSKIVDD